MLTPLPVNRQSDICAIINGKLVETSGNTPDPNYIANDTWVGTFS